MARARVSDYIARTIVPTKHYQQSLLRVPLPSLDKTCASYLRNVEPLVAPATFAQTKETIAAFEQGVGKELHASLQALDKSLPHSSWLDDMWFERYTTSRLPLPINVNPQVTLKDDPLRPTQAARAASLIVASARVMVTLRDGQYPPEVFHMRPEVTDTALFARAASLMPERVASYLPYAFSKLPASFGGGGAFPLDMSQFDSLFYSKRIPARGNDSIVSFAENEAKHVVVQKGSKFFTVDVLRDDGSVLEEADVHAALCAFLLKTRVRVTCHSDF